MARHLLLYSQSSMDHSGARGKQVCKTGDLFRAVTISVYILLSALSLCSSVVNADFEEDVRTLIILKEKMGLSDNTWNETRGCSDWKNIVCDGTSGPVTEINLVSSTLNGSIPSEISNLTSLKKLVLSGSRVSGSIPYSIGQLVNLTVLDLNGNLLKESIPDSIGNLRKLEILYLNGNYLTGIIPDSIGQLSNLTRLTLHGNYLTGSIPESIVNLTKLLYLDLSFNKLNGSIPTDIGDIALLTYFNIKSNRLSGIIPNSLYKQKDLKEIYFNGNQLSGTISPEISVFRNLSILYFQENQLSGAIPDEVLYLPALTFFDVSSNFFKRGNPVFNRSVASDISKNCIDSTEAYDQRNTTECESFCNSTQTGGPCAGGGTCYVPYLGTEAACRCFKDYMTYYDPYVCATQSPPAPPPPSQSLGIPVYVVVIIVISAVVGIVLVGILLWCLALIRMARMNSFDEKMLDQFAKSIPFPVLAAATDNFSEVNLLGAGGFGKVYKGVSADGEVWAVKRATNVTPESAVEFQQEVNAISTMFHQSILSLRGYCNENGEGILVYAFMANGTLKEALRRSPPLSFEQRINIGLGAAEGLHYLHHQARPTVIHRDVKSDNILLDEDMNAHVADFGFLKDNVAGGTQRLVGTPGYIDPEYMQTYEATTKSDVYSFGVVLLELITGRPAVFIEENEEANTNISLVRYVHERLQWDVSRMMDPKLGGRFSLSSATSLVALAEKCVSKFGNNRPMMQDVCARLVSIKFTLGEAGDEVGPAVATVGGGDVAAAETDNSGGNYLSIGVSDGTMSTMSFAMPAVPKSFMRFR